MANIQAQSQKRLAIGLTAVAFAIGYFVAEFLPTVAMMPSVSTAKTSMLGSGFALLQMLALVGVGFWTDRTKPRNPFTLAAIVFVLAALVGFLPGEAGLWANRILVGVGAGVFGSLLRTVGRTATSEVDKSKQLGRVTWASVFGGAVGTIFPIIGWQWTGDNTGRVILNVLVALAVAFFVARMPNMGRTKDLEARARLTLPIAILCTFSFFSAGAFAVFFLIVTKELVPNLSIPQTIIWPATAAITLIGAAAGSWINRHRGGKLNDARGLALAVLVCGIAYALPTLGYSFFKGNVVGVVLLAQFLAIVCAGFGDVFWAGLINRLSDPREAGATFGIGLTVAAGGRMFWPFLMSQTIENLIDWQTMLILAMAVALIGALLIALTADVLERKHK